MANYRHLRHVDSGMGVSGVRRLATLTLKPRGLNCPRGFFLPEANHKSQDNMCMPHNRVSRALQPFVVVQVQTYQSARLDAHKHATRHCEAFWWAARLCVRIYKCARDTGRWYLASSVLIVMTILSCILGYENKVMTDGS